MAGIAYLFDSNFLLRWVKPDHSDYPSIVSAIDYILQKDGSLCYTSQNVAEFWSACTRPTDRNGYGPSLQDADSRARLFEGRLRFLPDISAVHEIWRALSSAPAGSSSARTSNSKLWPLSTNTIRKSRGFVS